MPTHLDSLRGNVDPILTGLAQGVSNEAFVSQLLLPDVEVSKMTGRYPIFGAEGMRVHDAERAFKDDKVKRMPADDWTFGSYALKEYALEMVMDHLEIEVARDIADLEKYSINAVMNSLLLTKEYNIVQILQAAANYASGHSEALTSTDCWDHTSSKPLDQIKDAISTIRSKTGQYPNTLVIGLPSFHALQAHSTLIEKMKYSQLAVVTEDLISAMISTRENTVKVAVGSGIYQDPVTGNMVDLWGDVAVLAYVPQSKFAQRNKYESSFGYTFVKSGYPYGARESSKYGLTTAVAAFMTYQAAIVKNTAGYLFTNTKGS
jgi:hypothetical protein